MTGEWSPRRGRPRFAWPVRVDPVGSTGPTRGQAAGTAWRRTGKGTYVPAGTPDLPDQRVVEAYCRTGGRGAVTGWASLLLHGANYFDGLLGTTRQRVLLVEGDARLRADVDTTVLRARIPAEDLVVRYGVRCTIPERALLDHLALLDPRESVVAVDMALAAHTTSVRRLREYIAGRKGLRGAAALGAALDLADEHSASPQESRFRLVWQLDAGWARPLVNRDVFDRDGRFLGRPDLLDIEHGIVGEYAGAVHRSRDRHRNDVRREDLFRRAGLEYVEVVGGDLHDTRVVVDRMEAALTRAGTHPRTWRLGPEPTPLDDLLDHRDAMDALAEAGP